MPWQNPGSRITGEVITAADWNTDVAGNLQHLYNRRGVIRSAAVAAPGGASIYQRLGAWRVVKWDNAASGTAEGAHFPFIVPDDFTAAERIEVLLAAGFTPATIGFDISTNYCNPLTDNVINTHSESLTAQQMSFSHANAPRRFDLSAGFPLLDAGDIGSVHVRPNGQVTSGAVYALQFVMVYIRE